MRSNNQPFYLNISEKDEILFLVSSPFQVLCAYESIVYFKVKNYTILVIYDPKDSRTNQLFNTLEHFGLKYKTYIAENTNRVFDVFLKRKLSGNLGILKKFDFVFVGDYPSSVQRSFAIRYVKSQGQIVYTDDGNTSLLILQNKKYFSAKARCFNTFFKLLSLLKRIKKDVFFSTYTNISTKKTVIPNDLKSLKSNENSKEGIFFIGTNTVPYCEVHKIKTEHYYNVLEKALSSLKEKNKEQKYYYVFHGRDIGNSKIADICKKYNFETLKLTEIVEMHFIANKIEPLVVEGFTSSALFNLKKLFPLSRIIDINVKTNAYTNNEYENISRYYQNNGIEEIEVIINNDNGSLTTKASFQA